MNEPTVKARRERAVSLVQQYVKAPNKLYFIAWPARYYASRDGDRIAGYALGYWGMMGCIATLVINGEEVDQASCWGFESDGGSDYLQDEEKNEIAEVTDNWQAKAAKLADKHQAIAESLRKQTIQG